MFTKHKNKIHKILLGILAFTLSISIFIPFLISLQPQQLQAQTNAPVPIAPGQSQVFEIKYENQGQQDLANDAQLRILIGSELIVDPTSFTDQFNNGTIFPVDSSATIASNPGAFGTIIEYRPRSANIVGTPSGTRTPGDVDVPVGQQGVFRFRGTLKSDIISSGRFNVGDLLTPSINQGIKGRFVTINTQGVAGELDLKILDNTLTTDQIQNCPTQTVAIGSTYNCNFDLKDNPTTRNTYSLPAGGIVAGTGNLTGRSPACTIQNNGQANATLQCLNIPTVGGSAGLTDVNLFINGALTPTDKGDVNLSSSILTPADLQDCNPNNQNITIGATYNCNFTIINPSNTLFALPAGGIVAGTSGLTSRSPACTLTGSPIPTTLVCNSIPTAGSTAGTKNINLFFNGSTTENDKGDVNLSSSILTPADLQDCNPNNQNITIGATYNCNFTIINPSNTLFALPAGGIVAGTSGLTSRSPACTLTGSPIPTTLVCNSIPTAGSTAGTKNINLFFNGSTTENDKGDVNLAFAPCPNGATNPPACDICPLNKTLVGGQCINLPANPIIQIPIDNTTFTPVKSATKRFGESELSIKVTDNRITPGSTCNIQFRRYKNSTLANEALYTQTGLTNISGTYDAVTGCTATLPANLQTQARYEFRVRITDNNTGISSSPSLTYGIDTAYSLNFGAIGVVSVQAQ